MVRWNLFSFLEAMATLLEVLVPEKLGIRLEIRHQNSGLPVSDPYLANPLCKRSVAVSDPCKMFNQYVK